MSHGANKEEKQATNAFLMLCPQNTIEDNYCAQQKVEANMPAEEIKENFMHSVRDTKYDEET